MLKVNNGNIITIIFTVTLESIEEEGRSCWPTLSSRREGSG